jgi:hypothetical protein
LEEELAVAFADAFPETLEVMLTDALAVILAVALTLMLAVTPTTSTPRNSDLMPKDNQAQL